MDLLRILKIIITVAAILPMAGQASGWHRHRHHDVHDRFDHHYRSSHYRSSHYRYHNFPGHHYDYRPRYTEQWTVQDGWNRIKAGQSREALNIFEKISSEKPVVGQATFGMAVAAADTGALNRSIRAMRRLLEYNPSALRLFKVDDALKEKFARIVSRFEGDALGLSRADAFFMQAAFHYLLQNRETCLEAARQGKNADDKSGSALNLYFMAENDGWRFQPE